MAYAEPKFKTLDINILLFQTFVNRKFVKLMFTFMDFVKGFY
jgi:hypothetical protein